MGSSKGGDTGQMGEVVWTAASGRNSDGAVEKGMGATKRNCPKGRGVALPGLVSRDWGLFPLRGAVALSHLHTSTSGTLKRNGPLGLGSHDPPTSCSKLDWGVRGQGPARLWGTLAPANSSFLLWKS